MTIDTLRADRVGAYGDPLAQTPVMDALAARGTLFRDAHAVTPLTLPSHASILTGLYPVHHGLRDNGGFRLEANVPTLAEALQTSGYTTGAFVSAFVLDGAWGLARGFDTYHDPFHPQRLSEVGAFGEVELPGAEVINAASAWWGKTRDDQHPRFMWVHLYEPHTPWQPHSGWTGDPYRGEVAYADKLLGRLLKVVDDDALIVVTSDHGEGLWDHGEREHGVLLGPSITRVPLLIHAPGAPKRPVQTATERVWESIARRPEGIDTALELAPVPDRPSAARIVETPVSGVDIAPTIADYGGATLTGVDGRSLRKVLEGGSLETIPVYAETLFPLFHYGWSSLQMATDGQTRLERGVTTKSFDVQADPAAAHPTAAPAPSLTESLDRWFGDATPSPGPLSGEQIQALEALGYLTHQAPQSTAPTDPRDRINVLSQLHAAEAHPDAHIREQRLRSLVINEPEMVDARISLSLTLAADGKAEEAWVETQKVLHQWPEHPTALSNAGVLARTLGHDDQALQFAKRMQKINAADPRGYRLEAAILVDREDAVGVLEVTRRGVEIAPEDPNLHYLLALAEIQEGDPLVGADHLKKARAHGSRATDIDLWLGVAHQRAARIDEAVKFYDAATRSMAGDPRPWAMAGVMLWRANRCEEAKPFLINVARRGGAKDPQIRQALEACSTAPQKP